MRWLRDPRRPTQCKAPYLTAKQGRRSMVARVAGVCCGLIMIVGIWLASRGIAPARASDPSVYLPFVPVGLTQYFDDFSNPSSGWPAGNNSYEQFGYLNGEYQVYFLQPGRSFAVT